MFDSTKNWSWEQLETVRILKNLPGTRYQTASDLEKANMRDWVRMLLQHHSVTLTFVKADGAVREMLCTLNFDRIPQQHHPRPDNPVTENRDKNTHSLSVFDLEKQQWRSFRFERLQKVTAEIGFD